MTVRNIAPRIRPKLLVRPLIFFFALAYALAWGKLGVLHLIAHQSGIESGLVLLQMGETFNFGDSG